VFRFEDLSRSIPVGRNTQHVTYYKASTEMKRTRIIFTLPMNDSTAKRSFHREAHEDRYTCPGGRRQGEKTKSRAFFYYPDVLRGKIICAKV